MYHNPLTAVDMHYLTETLCGAHRPGHFKGVCTVVTKLFNIVQPDCAVFGQKDIQQVSVIMKMVNDLDFPVQIVVAPIVREDDGLAMSSRNVRLSPAARKAAASIFQALLAADELLASGTRAPRNIEERCNSILHESGVEAVDYITVVDLATLHPLDTIDRNCVLAIACHFGGVRLIDNMIIHTDGENVQCVY
jgi:pantoate--beta-alanine ligase